jgi:hypothetical protein
LFATCNTTERAAFASIRRVLGATERIGTGFAHRENGRVFFMAQVNGVAYRILAGTNVPNAGYLSLFNHRKHCKVVMIAFSTFPIGDRASIEILELFETRGYVRGFSLIGLACEPRSNSIADAPTGYLIPLDSQRGLR